MDRASAHYSELAMLSCATTNGLAVWMARLRLTGPCMREITGLGGTEGWRAVSDAATAR